MIEEERAKYGHSKQLAIVGGRNIENKIQFIQEIEQVTFPIDTIIAEGTSKANALAKKYALENNIDYLEYPGVGFKDPSEIVQRCDKLLAFWNGKNQETKSLIDLAHKSGKLLNVVESTINNYI